MGSGKSLRRAWVEAHPLERYLYRGNGENKEMVAANEASVRNRLGMLPSEKMLQGWRHASLAGGNCQGDGPSLIMTSRTLPAYHSVGTSNVLPQEIIRVANPR